MRLGSATLERLRAETPGTDHRIHLNNAGAALPPAPVLEAVRDHLELEGRIGGYEAADARRDGVEEAYRAVERLLGAPRGTVAFTEHATQSFVQALSAVPFRPGDRILTTRHDYVSNQIQLLSLGERVGVEVVRAPDRPEGGVDAAAMAEMVHRTRPRLVAMTHVPTNSGLVQDVGTVARVCRDREVWCLVDACQSVGQLPVDVGEIPCDFLSATGRKFLRGPRGVGFLYVSPRALEAGLTPLFPDLRGADWIDDDLVQPAPDARRFETWEFAWALVLGLGAAVRYALDVGVDAGGRRARELARRLRTGLGRLPGVRVLDRGPELAAIVTVAVEGAEPRDLVRRLRERGVNTSSLELGSGLLDFREKGVSGALRLSPHYYNTGDEVDRAVEEVEAVLPG